jgi:hypothetical protein
LAGPKNGREARQKPKEEIQVDALVDSFQADGTPLGVARREDGSLDYLYAQCPFTGSVELGVSRLADLAGSWRRA